MSETPPRTSYEVVVGRHMSPATLATFGVPVVPTAVPRNSVRRLRLRADERDIAEVVRKLTERDVELLEIRRCPEDPRWRPPQHGRATAPPDDPDGVVVPLPPGPFAQDDGARVRERADDGTEASPVSLTDARARRGRRPRRRTARGGTR